MTSVWIADSTSTITLDAGSFSVGQPRLLQAPAPRGATLGEAVREAVRAREQTGFSRHYVLSLRRYLAAFARGREDMPLADVTAEVVAQWFESRHEAVSTTASNRGRLRCMFSTARRRGWVDRNPLDSLDPLRWVRKTPPIFTVDQCRTALEFAKTEHPRMLATLALMLLAGIRPEEAKKISWAAVNFADMVVVVDSAASKIRRRRVVHLEPAAVEWLRCARLCRSELPVPRMTARRFVRALRDHLGLTVWPQDACRHSCASYWLAIRQDAGFVATQLGNSVPILMTNYIALVSDSDAKRFWSLSPFPV